MRKRGGQIGNTNGARPHIWTDAIRWALAQKDEKGRKRLRQAAIALIQQAEAGNVPALKELGDRLEGKAIQAIEAEVSGNITVEVVKFADKTTR